MCYSARVVQHLRTLEKRYGATVDWPLMKDLFAARRDDPKLIVGRALDANFDDPQTDIERSVKKDIDAFRSSQEAAWQEELFEQRRRVADAERKLAVKDTKAAQNDVRIGTNKAEQIRARLANLHRTERRDSDTQIYPKYFAPIIVSDQGRRWIRPMRYLCRLPNMPANTDLTLKGNYNARRDNLERFWKPAFGSHHAVMVVTSFFENVSRHTYEKRDLAPDEKETKIQLHFNPNPPAEMLVGCVWSHWTGRGERDLLSFAAITDQPPPEIAETGHDRVIVSIRERNLDEWLNPSAVSPARLQAILDEREAPYYEHRIAA